MSVEREDELEELRNKAKNFKETQSDTSVGVGQNNNLENIEGKTIKVREGTFDVRKEKEDPTDPNEPELIYTIPFAQVDFLENS